MSARTKVADFEWALGQTSTHWWCDGQRVDKLYDFEIGSAVVLEDSSGIAIVEPPRPDGLNAVVYNADGSVRFRVPPPQPDRHVAFQQMYYVRDELTAVAITRGNDWAVVVDAATGDVARTYETR